MPSDGALSAVQPYAAYIARGVEDVAADLDAYFALICQWQPVQNLVSRETLTNFWQRHAADSLQILRCLSPSDRLFLDFGSGAGLPLVPLATALKGTGSRFIAVEPNQRKASFLREVNRKLELSLEVMSARAEEIDSRETISPDVITARALAPLATLCALAAPLFGSNSRALFHKGREHVEELVESRALWQFDVLVVASDTGNDGALLEIRNLRKKT